MAGRRHRGECPRVSVAASLRWAGSRSGQFIKGLSSIFNHALRSCIVGTIFRSSKADHFLLELHPRFLTVSFAYITFAPLSTYRQSLVGLHLLFELNVEHHINTSHTLFFSSSSPQRLVLLYGHRQLLALLDPVSLVVSTYHRGCLPYADAD